MDLLVSESTSETNARIDNLQAALEELLVSACLSRQRSVGKIKDDPPSSPLEGLLTNPNEHKRFPHLIPIPDHNRKLHTSQHNLPLSSSTRYHRAPSCKPYTHQFEDLDDLWTSNEALGHPVKNKESPPRYERGEPRCGYVKSPPRYERSDPRRGYVKSPLMYDRSNLRHGYVEDITKKVKVNALEFDGRLDPIAFMN